MNDPIVEEIRKFREEYAKSMDYKLKRIYEDLKRGEEEHKEKVVAIETREKISINCAE